MHTNHTDIHRTSFSSSDATTLWDPDLGEFEQNDALGGYSVSIPHNDIVSTHWQLYSLKYLLCEDGNRRR